MPFVDVASFTAEEPGETQKGTFLAGSPPARTPFLSVYESEESGDADDPRDEEYATFLSELYDEEFDEAIFELVNEAAALHDEQFTTLSRSTRRLDSEALLKEHFEPLARELQRGLDAMAERLGDTDAANLRESDIDTLFEQFTPSVELSPSFENFWGKVADFAKKTVKKGADLAKKGAAIATGPLLAKLEPFIPRLIDKVLKVAIHKLPKPVRPFARTLAKRMGIAKDKELESPYDEEEEKQPSGDISQIQFEFNEQLANLLFAGSEVQQDLEVSYARAESREPVVESLAELDDAREEFINQLTRLKDGEDPTPLVENFLPALVPVAQTAVKMLGRKKVVDFLSKPVSQLIGKFIGEKQANALAGAMVDAGLGLLNLEVTPEDERRAASAAVAATVEDTVRRVGALPDYVFDDQELLEAFTVDAFEQAAAANLPPVLPEETYRKRPDLRESKSLQGTWVTMPLRGKPRYKKFCRTVRTRISPHKARAVESFGGVPLSDFFEDQLGLSPGSDFEADAHLYESISGTMLPEISRLETDTPGLGTISEAGYGQFHPLTREAAATLFGEPGVGREVDPMADRMSIGPGQRFYYLTAPRAKPVVRRDNRRRIRLRRPGGLKLILDFPKRQIRVCLYLSEVKAQALAVKLRKKAHVGAALSVFRELMDRGLPTALKRGGRGQLKIIHEAVTPEESVGGVLKRIPPLILDRIKNALHGWGLKAIAPFLKRGASQLIAATEAPEDGITMILTIANPPGFAALRRILKGKIPSLASLKFSGDPPDVNIRVVPGYSNG